MHWRRCVGPVVLLLIVWLAWLYLPRFWEPSPWTARELALMQAFSIDRLPAPPPDPSNRYADDPRAADFGHRLFFDVSLSANGLVACASCHQPERFFTDGLQRGQGMGQVSRNTQSVVGAAWSPWFTWDGSRDSQWSQALGPLEAPGEHGLDRVSVLGLLANNPQYHHSYRALFGPLPALPRQEDSSLFPASPLLEGSAADTWQSLDEAWRHELNQAFANVGKALAAYQRQLRPPATRFDVYLQALEHGDAEAEDLLSVEERRGLRLFMGKGRCVDCHNGPLFSNHEFHNTGPLSVTSALPDRGRAQGLRKLLADPFNCLGPYSDAEPEQCEELNHLRSGPESLGAMRTPSLRNLHSTAPYLHGGQMAHLREVLEHYNRPPLAMIGHNEMEQNLGLRPHEIAALEAFLGSLQASPPLDDPWWQAPQVRGEER